MLRFSYSKDTKTIRRQKRQCGGSKRMFWGMVMPNGLIYLKLVNGILNTENYISLLKNYGIKMMKLNMQPAFTFIQDNARPHVSKGSDEFLKSMKLNVLPWPAKSPDLNIMENIWKMISDIVYKDVQPANVKELEDLIYHAVDEINNQKRDTIENLFSSYVGRLTKVLVSQGNLLS